MDLKEYISIVNQKYRAGNATEHSYRGALEQLMQTCYDDIVLVDPISDYNGVLYPQALFDYIYAVLHSPSYIYDISLLVTKQRKLCTTENIHPKE